jgi:hypothetical protein
MGDRDLLKPLCRAQGLCALCSCACDTLLGATPPPYDPPPCSPAPCPLPPSTHLQAVSPWETVTC